MRSVNFKGETGSAVIELIGFGLLLQIPLVMLATNLLLLQHDQLAAEAITRDVLRSCVLLDSEPTTEAQAAAKALASKSACLACHAADKKLVGPAYKDVAAKHKGQADAVAKVAARIKSGGSGIYGPVPMPPQPNLKDDELKLLAEWVLAGAPDK